MSNWFRGSPINQDFTGLDLSGLGKTNINGMLANTFSSSSMSADNMSKFLIYCETTDITDIFFKASRMFYDSSATDAVAELLNRRWTIQGLEEV